jgi:hypothetical protein
MKIQQFAVPGRGEVSERKDRFHLRVGVDLAGLTVGEDVETGKDGERGVYYRRVSRFVYSKSRRPEKQPRGRNGRCGLGSVPFA